MTLRLVIGIDPGRLGALVALADGQPVEFVDMPTRLGVEGRPIVDARALAARLRIMMKAHRGAAFFAVIEHVCGFSGQGGASQFAFGRSDGIARGVLGALGLTPIELPPKVWREYYGLASGERRPKGSGRDFSRERDTKERGRLYAVSRWPNLTELRRKRDGGRADALLIAQWAYETEAWTTRTDAPADACLG